MQTPATIAPWVKRLALGLLLAVGGILLGSLLDGLSPEEETADGALSTRDAPRPLPPFRLQRAGGQSLSNDDLRGHWTFLFFGYTSCPDICPTTLAEMARLHDLLAKDDGVLADTRFVFVSVDPQRDSPDALATYTAWFSPDFIGATGDDAALTALTRPLKIRYRRGKPSAEGYLVEHASAVLLIDPQVRYHARLEAPHHAAAMHERYLELRRTSARTQDTARAAGS